MLKKATLLDQPEKEKSLPQRLVTHADRLLNQNRSEIIERMDVYVGLIGSYPFACG